MAPAWADEGDTLTIAAVIEAPTEVSLSIDSEAAAPPSTEEGAAAPDGTATAAPTHHQTGLIKTNVADLPERSLKCFCLTPDDRFLAGCVGGSGEIRVFDESGDYLESWSAPFEPDAIFVRSDGAVFVAGEGKLARLSPSGNVELEQQAPHTAAMSENLDKVREQVIAQNKQRAEMYAQQSKVYDEMLQRVDKQIAQVKEQIAALDEAAAVADSTDDGASESAKPVDRGLAMRRQSLERQLAMQERMKQQYEQASEQWAEMIANNKPKELTEEEIEQQVKAAITYKMRASSISATADEVFLATPAATGHGFEVWKMDGEFAGGERIISGLSGCCGQMDVKANAHGLFVAENGRHRVCRYDRDGELICQWGHGARTGVEGFGSCCNPMNVAFGPGDVVYTAEDDTGRIKRYSPEGELLGVVGSAELVPGCKNVSIAVNADGSRVYMLDITRGHIVRLEQYGPGEGPKPDTVSSATQQGETTAGGVVAKGLLKVLGIGQ